jgi:putative membrane protein
MADRANSGLSDYLAAERTFLAWIRTGLALMGFGFVVARFGLFLQALEAGRANFTVRPHGPSFWLGTGLIALGVVVIIASAWTHVRMIHDLNRDEPLLKRPSRLGLAVAVILAIAGMAMAIYLIAPENIKWNSQSDNGQAAK